jgi:hypothetical protein
MGSAEALCYSVRCLSGKFRGAVAPATWLGCFAEEMIIDLSPQMPRLRLYATKKNFSVCSVSFVVNMT